MIVVDSLAISKMLTNDIVVPILLRNRSGDIYRASLHSMRLSILLVVFLGYLWAMMAGGQFLLVEMGLLSFVAVTQCAPAILLGLAWPRGNRRGAFAGLSGGFALWFYTLIVPALVKEGLLAPTLLSQGPFGLGWLRPTALFGLDGLDSISHGLFWSLLVNLTAFVLVSLATRQDAEERLQAAAFTGRFPGEDGAPIGRSILSPREVERLVHHYVGGSEAAALARELLGDKPAPVSHDTYFGDCFVDNRLVVVEDATRIRKPLVLPTPGAPAPRSFVHAPIAIEERPIGVLSGYSSTGRVYFSPEFLQLFRTLAVQLGLGLHNAQLYRELDDLSRELEQKVRQRTGELEEANRRLTELDRLKSDFVSTVSHELRTPLTSIRSLSESLLAVADVPRERQEHFLRIITEESQRLSRMINQLLDLSRIEAGKMEWRTELLDLREVVAHAVQTHRALFERKGLALAAPAAEDPVSVLVDGDKMIQVLTNLLSNAAKFTPEGGRVSVRTFSEADRAVVEVEDTGVGIPSNQLDAIFERFRQVGDTLTRKPEGAGLGLPISREIVQHHGGTLTVRSAPGQGSCFRIVLPLAA